MRSTPCAEYHRSQFSAINDLQLVFHEKKYIYKGFENKILYTVLKPNWYRRLSFAFTKPVQKMNFHGIRSEGRMCVLCTHTWTTTFPAPEVKGTYLMTHIYHTS